MNAEGALTGLELVSIIKLQWSRVRMNAEGSGRR